MTKGRKDKLCELTGTRPASELTCSLFPLWHQAQLSLRTAKPFVHHPVIPKEDVALSLKFLLLGVLAECGMEPVVEKGWGSCGRNPWNPPRQLEAGSSAQPSAPKGVLPPPCSLFPVTVLGARRVWPWVWASLLHPSQGQSEQTYSTVKTGMPAVTITNLKPGTRYVFQIRAASPGPSWETQSFNPRIEVQTPGEGK